MRQLWAPWRLEYLQGGDDATGCIFCLGDDPAADRERLVVARGAHCFVMMNRYPYSNGHIMIAPFRHLADFARFTTEEVLEIHRMVVACRDALGVVCSAEGFNIGWNLGRVAGAGVVDHLHLHVVPRWAGDCNFMPVLADIRVIPQHIEDTRDMLADAVCARLGDAGAGFSL